MSIDWMGEAACADSERDFFKLTKERDGETYNELDWGLVGPLVEICAECPVLRQCAKFAMRTGAVETHGVWAGTYPSQRPALSRADDVVQAVVDTCMTNYAKALAYRSKGEQISLEMGAA